MCKVSIIMPVYNTKKFLKESLDSLMKQTLKDIEIIAIDDGSTDGSYELLLEYQKKDKRIIVAKNKKKGVGSARNTGFELSTGEYIGFLDSDDFVDKTMYEKLYKKAEAGNAEVAIGGVNLYNMQTGEEEPFRQYDLYEKYSSYPCFNAKRFPEIIQNIGIWDRIYKREFLVENSILNVDVSYEDHFYSIQTTVLADRICVVNEPFYKYRKNAGTSITDRECKSDKLKFALFEQKKMSKEFLINEHVYQIFQNPFLFYQYQEALYCMQNASKKKNFKALFDYLREMTNDADYGYLQTVTYNGIDCFARYIQNNQKRKCYFWLKNRR